MKDIILTSSPVEEARRSALNFAQEGKKPGKNLFVVIGETMGLFMLSQIATCVGIVIYLSASVLSITDQSDGFRFEFNLTNGLIDKNLVLIMLFTEIFMILIFMLYARFKENRSLSSLGIVKAKMIPSYLIGILGAAVSMIIATVVCLITRAFTIEKTDCSILYFSLYALGWIIQGLAEEVMCRGFLMTSIARCYSLKTAVIANSIVFAVLHVLNPSGITVLAFVNLFLYGVFASMMFIYSENIWLCAGFHTVWNMIQGNVLGIPVSGIRVPSLFAINMNENLSLINGGAFGLEGGLCVTAILIAGCMILFALSRKKSRIKRTAVV